MLVTSEAQKRAINKYQKKAYTQVNIRVRKERGEFYREFFRNHPDIKMNQSIISFLDNLTGYKDNGNDTNE